MTTQSDDLARYREEQRRQWDSVAAGWKKWWPTIENGAQNVSQRMIELAEVRPGHQVLDIATGIGEPALLAAGRVGPAGRVIATDLSFRMLDIARERAAALGMANVEFMEADAERRQLRRHSLALGCDGSAGSIEHVGRDTTHAGARWLVRHSCLGSGAEGPASCEPCDDCRPGDV